MREKDRMKAANKRFDGGPISRLGKEIALLGCLPRASRLTLLLTHSLSKNRWEEGTKGRNQTKVGELPSKALFCFF